MSLRNKDMLLVPMLIFTGKALAFVFNALLGAYYGVGKVSDAFIMAHTIPTILFDGAATAFISCYIPIQRTLKHDSPEIIDNFNSNMTNILFLLSIIITLVYLIFQEKFNRFYGNGFDAVSFNLLNKYTTIIICSIPFIGTSTIFRAHLQVSGRKTISSIGQTICYLLLIIAIIAFYPKDISLAWATLFGNIMCFIVFLFFCMRTGYIYKPKISFKEHYIKILLSMIFPIFFITLTSELLSMIDKFFASQYSDGIITSLTYGHQLSFAIQGIISTSLLIVIFPSLADKVARKDEIGMNNVVYICIDIVCWVVLPIVSGCIVIAEPIIKLLFGHGKFSYENVRNISVIFAGYLFGVFPMCIKHIVDRTFFALKRTKYLMFTTFIVVGMNILLDYVMIILWSYMGLIIATNISIIIGSVTSFIFIKRIDITLSCMKILWMPIYPSVCCLIMGVAILLIKTYMIKNNIENSFLIFVTGVLVGIITYFVSGMLLFRKKVLGIFGYLVKSSK